MDKFPYDKIGDLTVEMSQLSRQCKNGNFVYSIEINPDACSYRAHVNWQMFKQMVNANYQIETQYLDEAVYLSATCGFITVVTCVLKYEMLMRLKETASSLEELYRKWSKEVDWPYVQKD